MFRRLVATSRAPQSMVEHVKAIWQKLTKYGRGCPAGTGGHPESGTPSKVWSWALVCWSTAILKSSFTKKSASHLSIQINYFIDFVTFFLKVVHITLIYRS